MNMGMTKGPDVQALLRSPESLARLIENRLHRQDAKSIAFNTYGDLKQVSAVLFLLGKTPDGDPILILNKRSRHVRQPGDLCCPGGGISPVMDGWLARCLHLPATPLTRWPYATWWRRHRKSEFPKLALLLAAGLREGMEEMRLNPFGFRFLGPMAVQHLVMFKRSIYPMVGWVTRQRRFFPNWEVEKIVPIPLTAFFEPDNYARCRISFKAGSPGAADMPYQDFPCFIHHHHGREELLWGATYRITHRFLTTLFGHVAPPMESLPIIHRRLDRNYLGRSPS